MLGKRVFKFIPKFSRKEGLFCSCDSTSLHSTKSIDCFPLVGGRCTAFMFGKCSKCNGWSGFPSENFELAITEGTEEGVQALKEISVPVSDLRQILEGEKYRRKER